MLLGMMFEKLICCLFWPNLQEPPIHTFTHIWSLSAQQPFNGSACCASNNDVHIYINTQSTSAVQPANTYSRLHTSGNTAQRTRALASLSTAHPYYCNMSVEQPPTLQMQRTVSIGHGSGTGKVLKVTFSAEDFDTLMGGSPKLGERPDTPLHIE